MAWATTPLRSGALPQLTEGTGFCRAAKGGAGVQCEGLPRGDEPVRWYQPGAGDRGLGASEQGI